MIVLIMSG